MNNLGSSTWARIFKVRIRPEALEALAEKGPGYSRYPRDEAPAPAGKVE